MGNMNVSEKLARSELIDLQKEILRETLQELKEYRGEFTPEMKRYYREYKREVADFSRYADVKELIKKIPKSDIVYCGDYHTLGQAQKAQLKILSEILKERKDVLIGMEMVYIQHQKVLDSYIRGEISEGEFLEGSKYYEKWGFNWENYKPILRLAIDNGLRVIGLNYPAFNVRNSLSLRDTKAAQIIARLTLENPDKLIFVIFGDMHIASTHLPRRVKNELDKKNVARKHIIVFQNSDDIYFKLVKRNMENKIDVVMLKRNTYCIMNTTPYIKYQSRIHWMEDRDYYVCKFYDIGIDKGSRGDEVVFEDDVEELIDTLTRYFMLSADDIPDFQVFSYDSKILVNRMRDNNVDMKYFRRMLKLHDSFFIPEHNILCLGKPNTNHMAEQATVFLYHVNSLYDEGKLPFVDRYFARIIINALGFLGSKIINPKRKCSRIKDYAFFLEKYHNRKLKGKLKSQRESAKGLLRHYGILDRYIKDEGDFCHRFKSLFELDQRVLGLLSKSTGQILGENLFYAILQELISKKEIRKLFFNDFRMAGSGFQKYIELEKVAASVDVQYESKRDRF